MTKQPTLTKADLIEEVLKVTELPRKESETIVETIFESIIDALQKGDKIEIRGFGSFRTRQRNSRIGRNPKTGERVDVPAKRVPFFKPSKELRDSVNPGGVRSIAKPAKTAAEDAKPVDPHHPPAM
jgi:integration host factor subunit beta